MENIPQPTPPPVRQTRRKRVTYTLTPDTIQRLEEIARLNHTSMSGVITSLIWGYSDDRLDHLREETYIL